MVCPFCQRNDARAVVVIEYPTVALFNKKPEIHVCFCQGGSLNEIAQR